jgi:uncharacterized YigZ family protein
MPELIDVYKTIASPSKGIFKDKGSKFMAFAFSVSNEQEIKLHIESIKKEYFDARHHCYAYAIGINRQQQRSFDDGEPAGTAGKPIYNQIVSANLTNILVVVVRYFGGTLLGKSGLIQAYKMATIDAITNSKVIEKTENTTISLTFPYQQLNEILRILRIDGVVLKNQHYDNICSIEAEVRISLEKILVSKLLKLDEIQIQQS